MGFGRIVLLLAWAQLWVGLTFFGSTLVCYVLLAVAQGLILVTYIGKLSTIKYRHLSHHSFAVLEIRMDRKSPISHRDTNESGIKSTTPAA